MKAMAQQETRTALLKAGIELMRIRGYNHTGLKEILDQVGVPKGSFYHFFDSKEAFGQEALDYYVAQFEPFMQQFFSDTTVRPLQRIRNFFEASRQRLESEECRGGCIVGNFAQELADQDEAFRESLARIMEGWEARFTACLEEAQRDGDITSNTDVRELAQFLFDSWEGAILRMKTTKDIAPVDSFINVIFNSILKT